MVIKVLDHVPHCYSWADGEVICRAVRCALREHGRATISFAGVSDVPTSFVNAAFAQLLGEYTFDYIRSHVSIVNSTRQINEMIKRRLVFEAQRRPAA